jgi:putative transposase
MTRIDKPAPATVLNNNACPAVQVGGIEDHVHLFFGPSRTLTVAKIVETLKTSSSKWLKTKDRALAGFHWQAGYGAFSVSASDADAVVRYIEDQAVHHQKTTFQEEYLKFLQRYGITYDERYVWD